MTPEGKVKERVKKILRKHGVYYYMPVSNGMGAPSLDFICCAKGRFLAIETKAANKGMTHRQMLTAKDMARAGAMVFLVNEASDLPEKLDLWLSGIE